MSPEWTYWFEVVRAFRDLMFLVLAMGMVVRIMEMR